MLTLLNYNLSQNDRILILDLYGLFYFALCTNKEKKETDMEEKTNEELFFDIMNAKWAIDTLLDILMDKQIITYEERCKVSDKLCLFG